MFRFTRLTYKLLDPDGGQGGAEDTSGSGTNQGGSGSSEGDQTHGSGTKTFTQDEVNTIGAREKSQGKNSILKIFGCADEKAAKAEAEEFKKWKESQKTEEEKKSEEKKKLEDSASESEKRAIAAENKLAALKAGVNSDSVDDALAIALLKVTDDKTLDKVFEEMKKESRYSGFFGTGSSLGGTGSSADHNRGGQGTDNIGKRLAENKVKSTYVKSSFFSKS